MKRRLFVTLFFSVLLLLLPGFLFAGAFTVSFVNRDFQQVFVDTGRGAAVTEEMDFNIVGARGERVTSVYPMERRETGFFTQPLPLETLERVKPGLSVVPVTMEAEEHENLRDEGEAILARVLKKLQGEKMDKMREEIAALGEEMREAKRELRVLRERESAAEEKVRKMERRFDRDSYYIENDIDDLEGDIEDLVDEREKLYEERNALLLQDPVPRDRIRAIGERIDFLTRKIRRKREEKRDLRRELRSLKRDLGRARADLREARGYVKDAVRHIRNLAEKREDLFSRLREMVEGGETGDVR